MSTKLWKIDAAHSTIQFTVRHMVVAKVHGQFRRFEGELSMDDADPSMSFVTATIEAASIDTGNEQRDNDLRGSDFFGASDHPKMSFTSRRVQRDGDKLRVIGEMTIKGVTREVTLDAELGGFIVDPWGNRRVGLSARGSVLRSEFGMVWNQALDAGGVVVADRVDFEIDVEAVAHVAERAVA